MKLVSKVNCRVINSGYKQDYGYKVYNFVEVVSLDGVPTIRVKSDDSDYTYLAWFRNGNWVLDFD